MKPTTDLNALVEDSWTCQCDKCGIKSYQDRDPGGKCIKGAATCNGVMQPRTMFTFDEVTPFVTTTRFKTTRFKSAAYTAKECRIIQNRAARMCPIDHGDMAVLLARLEYEARAVQHNHPRLQSAVEAINAVLGAGK